MKMKRKRKKILSYPPYRKFYVYIIIMGERTIIKNGKNNTELTNKEKKIQKEFNKYYFTNTPKPTPKSKPKPTPKPTPKNKQKPWWEQEFKHAKTKKELRKKFIQASKELHPNKGGTSANFNKMFKLYTNLSQRT